MKTYHVIINGKHFYDQLIDSYLKRYKEIRNFRTDQGEDYATVCLLDYGYTRFELNTAEVLIFKALIDSNISHEEFVSMNVFFFFIITRYT